MPIDFPSSPSLNQTYTVGTKTWIWNGYAWDLQLSSATTGFSTANGTIAWNTANAAFIQANTPSHVANSAAIYANGAFAAANAATATDVTQNSSIAAAFVHANSSFNFANGISIAANTPSHVANSAAIYANGAFIRANNSLNANVGGTITGNVTVVGNLTSNTITTTGSNGSISGANAIFSNYVFAANGTVDLFIYANNAYTTANGAFAAANAATTTNITQNNSITVALNTANAAFIQANTPSHVANSAAIYANGAFAAANAATATDVTQNNSITVALNTSNAAFIRANNSLDVNTGGIITGNLTVTQNLSVGNLFVTGQVVSINASTLVANDTLIVLGAGNYASDLKDLGFAGHYNDGTNAHSGLIRDFGTKEWYLFKNYTPEVGGDNNININDASFTIDTLNANIRSTIVLSKGIDLLVRTNTIFDLANAAFIQANTPSHVANSAAIYANGAFAAANASAAIDVTQNNSITVALNTANAAFAAANTGGADQYARNTANAAFTVANAAITFTSSSTPPSSPSAGDQWYNTNNDILYEYINDGTSDYWVDITSSAITTSNISITSSTSGSVDILNPFLLAGM
jgi:hypothetical protein